MKNFHSNQKAAALAYDQSSHDAPRVVASGQGAIASTIINKAKEFDIPLFSNTALVDSLLRVEIDTQIPPELYNGVVEVFIWLNQVEKDAQMSK